MSYFSDENRSSYLTNSEIVRRLSNKQNYKGLIEDTSWGSSFFQFKSKANVDRSFC